MTLKTHLDPDVNHLIANFCDIDAHSKISWNELRIVMLSQNCFLGYIKDLLFDNQGSCGGFAYSKKTFHAHLFSHQDPTKTISEIFDTLYKKTAQCAVIFQIWKYDQIDKNSFDLDAACLNLSSLFYKLFPKITPQIIYSNNSYCMTSSRISMVYTRLSDEIMNQESVFVIDSVREFNLHIKSLYLFLKTLYDNKLCHGDLSYTNCILNKNGFIKGLIDFDRASTLSLNKVRFIRGFASDLIDVVSAMLYYNEEPWFEDWKNISTSCSISDRLIIQEKVEKLHSIKHQLTETYTDFKFFSDFKKIDSHQLNLYLELLNPARIFSTLSF